MRYDNKKPLIIRRVLFSAFIALAALFQSTASVTVGSFSCRALLVIPLVVAIAMFEREIAAALFGALGGVILDIASAKDGFNTLILIIICAVCSLLISHLMRNNFVTGTVLCAASLAVYTVAYIIAFDFSEGVFPLNALFMFYIPSFAASLVSFFVMYFSVRAVYKYLKEEYPDVC